MKGIDPDKDPIEEVKKAEEASQKEIEQYSAKLKTDFFKFKKEKEEELRDLFFSLKSEIDEIKQRGEVKIREAIEKEKEKTEIDCKKIEEINNEKIRKQVSFIKDKIFDYS